MVVVSGVVELELKLRVKTAREAKILLDIYGMQSKDTDMRSGEECECEWDLELKVL